MKFILDANMPLSAKSVFADKDEVIHVRDVGLGSASDSDILKYALREQAIVITRDLDFANIILHPVISHAGVIVLRVPSSFTAKQIVQFLAWFLKEIGDKHELLHALTIVEPNRFRVRR